MVRWMTVLVLAVSCAACVGAPFEGDGGEGVGGGDPSGKPAFEEGAGGDGGEGVGGGYDPGDLVAEGGACSWSGGPPPVGGVPAALLAAAVALGARRGRP